jgi:type I restriction enzyme S subunit
MSEFRTIRELCSVVVDCPHSTPKWTANGKIVIRNNNIKHGRIDFSSPSYTDDEHFAQRIKRAKPQPGDIIITREAPIGDVGMIPENTECCLGQRMVLLRANQSVCDNFYLLYSLQSLYVQHQISWSEGTGTTVSNLRIPHLEQIQIPYLPLEQQAKISSVLRALEEKIENNRRLNDNLQQQAMSLYAEMFLNSSDSNVTSGTLSDIAVITMGQSPSGSSYNEDGVGEVFYQGRAEFGFRFPKRRLFTTEPKRMAEAGDVLLSVRAPVGDLNIAYERCCIGRGLGAIHSKTGHSSFILYTMFALRSQLDVFNGEGTVFGSINRDALNAIPIDIPPVTEIDQFEVVAHPIDELIRANYEENCRLEAIRDSLLPKLMSGEIDVSAVQL